MNNRKVIITVFVISVLGLAFVQYRYLQIGLNLAKIQFNEKVEQSIADIKLGLRDQNQLTYLMASAMKRDTSFFRTSPDSVIDASSYFLKDYLAENLAKHGVEADFSYTLMTRDSSYYLNSAGTIEQEKDIVAYPILVEGYLPKLFEQRFILNLRFNSLNSYFLSQLNGLTLPGLLFLVGILLVVIWALRTYYWQRKLITTTDEFINNLTHELKTPVFSINLASKMLENAVFEKDKTYLNIIRQQAGRLTVHIEKVLELANLDRKRAVLQLERIDFHPNLEKVCEAFKALGAMEEIQFSYTLQPGEYWIKAEAFHLENTVNNLLDNAKKYGDTPKIHLESHIDERTLVIRIQDTGKGISKQEQQKVFQKYYRAKDGASQQVKGYGLGLNYVKTIVKKHHGKINLESKVGIGTTVTIKIPLMKDARR